VSSAQLGSGSKNSRKLTATKVLRRNIHARDSRSEAGFYIRLGENTSADKGGRDRSDRYGASAPVQAVMEIWDSGGECRGRGEEMLGK